MLNSNGGIKDAHVSLVGIVVKTKIRNKIIVLVVAICLFSLLGMSAAAFFTINNMAGYSRNINAALGRNATEGASGALLEQASYFLRIIAREQSNSCENALNAIKFNITMVSGVVRDLFGNPQNYGAVRGIVTSSEAADGVYTNTYSLPASVPMTPAIRRELDLLSNLSLLMPTLTENPNIIDLYVGMESGLFYNYTAHTFENSDYDPRERPWYVEALKQPGDIVFTDVYEDAFANGMVITAAKALYDDNGQLLGVAGLDIQLENLKELVLGMRITDSGHAFIINRNGMYVVHPDMGKEGFEPYVPEGEDGFAEGYRRMMDGEEGFASAVIDGESHYMTFSPISVADWSIGVIVHESDLLSVLKSLTAEMDGLAAESEANIEKMSNEANFIFVIILFFDAVMVAILSVGLTRLISKPIQRLTEEVVKVGEGNFEYRIPVETQDEIGFLTNAFNEMADNLYKYAKNIMSLNQEKTVLEITANTDALTGVLSRRYFTEAAANQLEHAVTENRNAFVVMFDLDHFKSINDTYGHPGGDKVLKDVTAIVKQSIRSGDLLARYGGEEFIMLVTGITEDAVMELIERMRQRICKEPVDFGGVGIPVSASFGVAAAYGNDLGKATLFADKALYKAKKEGRNRVVMYDYGEN